MAGGEALMRNEFSADEAGAEVVPFATPSLSLVRKWTAHAGGVEGDVVGRHAAIDGIALHRHHLVVFGLGVVAGHQQLLDGAGLVEGDGGIDALRQDAREPAVGTYAGPEDERHAPVRHCSGIDVKMGRDAEVHPGDGAGAEDQQPACDQQRPADDRPPAPPAG